MNLFKNVHESWIPLLHSLAYQEPLEDFLNTLSNRHYLPKYENIFRVFEMPVKNIKLVILGEEPYSLPGDAIGYAYIVNKKRYTPKSVENIKKEILLSDKENIKNNEINIEKWVEQGVFLLNSALTVEAGEEKSHIKYWKKFTEMVITFISNENPCVWLLMGKNLHHYKGRIKLPLEITEYNKDTIEEIPIDKKINYTICIDHPEGKDFSENNSFYYINRVLDMKENKKIVW